MMRNIIYGGESACTIVHVSEGGKHTEHVCMCVCVRGYLF